MFDNIVCLGDHWVCHLDEPYEDNHLAYTGDFEGGIPSAVTGADVYW